MSFLSNVQQLIVTKQLSIKVNPFRTTMLGNKTFGGNPSNCWNSCAITSWNQTDSLTQDQQRGVTKVKRRARREKRRLEFKEVTERIRKTRHAAKMEKEGRVFTAQREGQALPVQKEASSVEQNDEPQVFEKKKKQKDIFSKKIGRNNPNMLEKFIDLYRKITGSQ